MHNGTVNERLASDLLQLRRWTASINASGPSQLVSKLDGLVRTYPNEAASHLFKAKALVQQALRQVLHPAAAGCANADDQQRVVELEDALTAACLGAALCQSHACAHLAALLLMLTHGVRARDAARDKLADKLANAWVSILCSVLGITGVSQRLL